MVGQSVPRGRYFYYRCNRLYLPDAEKRCLSRQVRKDALETAVLGAIEGVLANPELAVGMAKRLRVGTDHGARLAALGGEISQLTRARTGSSISTRTVRLRRTSTSRSAIGSRGTRPR